MNTCSTLPESYQQRMYEISLATIKHQIQQAENSQPALVNSMGEWHVGSDIILDYLTYEVVLEKPVIRSTDPEIPIPNNCTDVELHFGRPWRRKEYKDEGDEINGSHAIPTTSRLRWATIELERFVLGTSEVDGYKGDDGDDATQNKGEAVSQASDRSMQILEDWEHSTRDWSHWTRECEDWTVYIRFGIYHDGEGNATSNDVAAVQTVL